MSLARLASCFQAQRAAEKKAPRASSSTHKDIRLAEAEEEKDLQLQAFAAELAERASMSLRRLPSAVACVDQRRWNSRDCCRGRATTCP